MKLSKLFGRTIREVPTEAENISHQLLLRAGFIRKLSAGIYSFLPLGWRVIKKIENIIREEMDRIEGQEIHLPALHPKELWEESGRWSAMGEVLMKLKDRKEADFCLAPTHEEVVTDLARREIISYRQLPQMVYQIQTKFRDEPRPRAGLLRMREFIMKDAYSFHPDIIDLDNYYPKVKRAYENIFRRCGLEILSVEADTGPIGGTMSHEFMVKSEAGEDEIVYCQKCNYLANVEKAECQIVNQKSKIKNQNEEIEENMEEVSTPGIKTVEELKSFLNIDSSQLLKTVIYKADDEIVLAVIRGDLKINEVKLFNNLKCKTLRLAADEEVEKAGLVAGFVSPVGIKNIKIIADRSIKIGKNFVAGGNKVDVHLKNVNYPRDFTVTMITDLILCGEGSLCPHCGSKLSFIKGIELGHIFKLGTKYSKDMNAIYLSADGKKNLVAMGCYGIGLERIMAAVVESHHDEKGIIWPKSIAPFDVHLITIGDQRPAPFPLPSGERSKVRGSMISKKAEEIYRQLIDGGLEVLYDDRDWMSAGEKFADADLIGVPLRIVVSEKTLAKKSVEIKKRDEKEAKLIKIDKKLVDNLKKLNNN
jgi:prolyl-tRNA synthetase